MLPGAHGQPPSGLELLVSVGVAPPVARDLLRPVPRVLAHLPATMFRAPMPEAAVDEHGDPLCREDEIRGPPQIRKGASVNEVAETPSVYSSTDSELRGSVLSILPLHAEAGRLGRRERGGGYGRRARRRLRATSVDRCHTPSLPWKPCLRDRQRRRAERSNSACWPAQGSAGAGRTESKLTG